MADPLDVLSIDDARELINFGDTQVGSDPIVARFITFVSRKLDALCGAIVQREVTKTVSGGSRAIFLTDPVATVTSIVEWSGVTPTTLTAEVLGVASTAANYYLDKSCPQAPILYRRSGGGDSLWASGRGNIVLTFVAGRFATTEDVDDRFRTAAMLALKHLWDSSAAWWQRQAGFGELGQGNVGSPIPGWLIPKAALEGISDELLPPAVA
jgi:hypothetical protein